MQKRCTDCGKTFDPSHEGVAGKLDGKEINFCSACCHKED